LIPSAVSSKAGTVLFFLPLQDLPRIDNNLLQAQPSITIERNNCQTDNILEFSRSIFGTTIHSSSLNAWRAESILLFDQHIYTVS